MTNSPNPNDQWVHWAIGYWDLVIFSIMSSQKVIRLSISEAARIFGIHERTIRRAIRKHELNYVVVQGRYKINFESALKWSQKNPTIRNKSQKFGIGQYVEKWRIANTLYSPNPAMMEDKEKEPKNPNSAA